VPSALVAVAQMASDSPPIACFPLFGKIEFATASNAFRFSNTRKSLLPIQNEDWGPHRVRYLSIVQPAQQATRFQKSLSKISNIPKYFLSKILTVPNQT
jgi:hypothetical protein